MASKVHRVRYYNPKPQPVNCASLNKTTKHLAIARGDASIEIWDLKYAPIVLKFIPGVENGSVEALCWVNDRLLSTGLGGALVEWDLERLTLKNTTLLTGYAAWCLDVSPDNALAAVGTEQGYINLFSVENDDILYKKLFDKQEGRILCCKFNTTGNILATGSIDTIRVWNVQTGHAVSRMSVSRRGKEVIVWCLAFLSDNTVASGDSLGRLTFWDGSLGDQIESFTSHKADITAIAVSDDEQNLYCSGVDPVIMHFKKVAHSTNKTEKAKLQWVKNVQRNIHEHDVRALLTSGEQLISVGIDGYLTFSSYPPKWTMRVPPMIPAPRSAVCAKKKLLLLRYSNSLEIWKLGTYEKNAGGYAVPNVTTNSNDKHKEQNETKQKVEQDSTDAMYKNESLENTKISLKLTEKPVNLISVQTKKKKQIRCCEMSPSGDFIFYSTDSDIRMLKLELEMEDDQNNIYLSRLYVSGLKSPCDRVAFSDDSHLMVAHCPGTLHVLQVDANVGATVTQTINTDKFFKTKTILHLVVSKPSPSGATYLVAVDTESCVAIWKQKGKKFEHYATLPTYTCVPSAVSVDSEREVLYMTYVDQRIIEYEIANKKFVEWKDVILPAPWGNRRAAMHSVSRHPTRNALVFHDQNSLWIVEKEYGSQPTPRKLGRQQDSHLAELKLPYKIIPVKYLAGFHWLENDEAVTLELLPGNILAQLPPVVAQKKH